MNIFFISLRQQKLEAPTKGRNTEGSKDYSVLLTKIIGLRITQDRKIKQKKYLLEKNVTFRSSIGMLQTLIMLIDLRGAVET